MTIWGFDVDSYNKAGFAFQTARAQGYTCALIKFGGMNLPGNAPYMMNGYHAFVQAALDVGFDAVGDYLVTGGSNPAAAADFWLANRHGGIDFHELDNEKLDSGNPFNDGQACVYFDRIGTAADRWMYGSRDSLWNAQQWSGLASRRIKAHVAIYNGSPFSNIYPRTYPSDLVLAHQFTSSASIGGLGAVDANAYADGAFVAAKKKPKPEEGDMLVLISTPAPVESGNQFDWWVQNIDNKTYWHVENGDQLNYLRTIVTPNGTGMEVHENEPVNVLAGFTLIPTASATLAIDSQAANDIGAAMGAAIKFPGYKATTEVVPS